MADASVEGLVDHLFRREAGRMVATLARSFGPAHLDLAEEVVQEALIRALKLWPFEGVPESPRAWLMRVARNLALDRLRRDASLRGKEAAIRVELERDEAAEPVYLAGEITDDQLRLIFLCCHPEVPRDSRVALTLKLVGGFSVPEIARAFLAQPATVAQRLVRAQRRIRARRIPLEVPGPGELPERLEAVLEVVYLMFNEGYAAHDGDALVRADLCGEALRLAGELARLPATEGPAVHALAALLAFQASRLPARVDDGGELVVLADQDRSRWDRGLLGLAFAHFERAAAGPVETEYHLQAAIAAHHAAAPSAAETDWAAVLELYDRLVERNPSPVVALNRAVAVARVHGPEDALAALDALAGEPAVAGYYLLPATRAELLLELGDPAGAAAALRRAIGCACSGPERRFLKKKLEGIGRP